MTRRALFGTLMALALALPAVAAEEPQRTLSLSGQGEVRVSPDLALVTVGASADAGTAQAALDETSAKLAAMMAALATAGVEARDMATSGLFVGPTYREGYIVTGYRAQNMLEVRVRDLSRLGTLLDALAEAGATDIRGVQFDLADRTGALAEARKRAVADALARASLIAEAAGVTLGPILTIAETGGHDPMPPMFARAAMAESDSVPVAEGELTIRAGVAVVWQLR